MTQQKQAYLFIVLLFCILCKVGSSIFTFYRKDGFDYRLGIAISALLLIAFQVFKIAKNSYFSKDK